jgi:MerR family copper efflux transcriptional regulator
MSSEPIVCTLNTGDQDERAGQWRHLLARADRREPIEGGLRFHLPAALAGPAADLAAAEQQCCAFFDFTLRLAGGGLHLEIRAPAEAAPLMADVFGATA